MSQRWADLMCSEGIGVYSVTGPQCGLMDLSSLFPLLLLDSQVFVDQAIYN